ncbi:MAG: phosphomannomutase/phosphoglucomutase [Syntrophales bacterium]|jgi:phosphomannomutase/phosphoglucomutase|nr:phosphomannomutase/phosphoglucomutase [Syntrophales bacterium]
MINRDVFREYDIRGMVDTDLTPEFVLRLGRAIGTCARDGAVQTLALGRDCRLSSENLHETLKRGLNLAGVDVLDIGLCTTPMLYFAIRHLRTGGGVMITGSHNPPDFNGFKICIGPDTIYGDAIQHLYEVMVKGAFAAGTGGSTRTDIAEAYGDYLFRNVEIKNPPSIALDGGNGTGGLFALPLLRRFGCRVMDIHCDPDGRFPNHFPDPTVPENLKDLIRLVKEKKADLGIGYDGDADRIGVVTDRGDILWGDELLILFSRFVLEAHPGATVIGDVKCSQKLYDDIAARGGRPIMWKAGHSLIKEKMKTEGALLAGEMSGHVFFADRYFGYDDATYATLRLLEILSRTGAKLSEMLDDLPRTFSTPEIRVNCPDAVKFRVVEAVKADFGEKYAVNTIDGLRITFPDGWGLLRPSNTQPVVVLRFESETESGLQAIRDLFESALREKMDELVP